TGPLQVVNESGGLVARLTGHTAALRALAVAPYEGLLAAAGDHATGRLRDTGTWRVPGTPRWQAPPRAAPASAPDGRAPAPAPLVRLGHGLHVGGPPAPGPPTPTFTAAGPVAFSADGKTVAAAGAGGEVVLIDAAHRRVRTRLPGDGGAVAALAFAPGGELLA